MDATHTSLFGHPFHLEPNRSAGGFEASGHQGTRPFGFIAEIGMEPGVKGGGIGSNQNV